MDTYDHEIYKYLTIPKNYSIAKQIAERIYSVDEQLKLEFWQEVDIDLNKRLDSSFKFFTDNEIFDITKSTWLDTSIAFERNTYDFGIGLKRKLFQMDKVIQ